MQVNKEQQKIKYVMLNLLNSMLLGPHKIILFCVGL